MKIILTKRAKMDRLKIFNYNCQILPSYAIRMDKKIRLAIKDLEVYPYIGRYVPELHSKDYRERICEKYRIVYFFSENIDTIYILYIFNSRQNFNF